MPRAYYVDEGTLARWNACDKRFAACRRFPDGRIPITPEAYDLLSRHDFYTVPWFGYIVCTRERAQALRGYVNREIAALRPRYPGQQTTLATMTDVAAHLRHSTIWADVEVLTSAYRSLLIADGLSGKEATIASGAWMVCMILRVLDAEPEGTPLNQYRGQ